MLTRTRTARAYDELPFALRLLAGGTTGARLRRARVLFVLCLLLSLFFVLSLVAAVAGVIVGPDTGSRVFFAIVLVVSVAMPCYCLAVARRCRAVVRQIESRPRSVQRRRASS